MGGPLGDRSADRRVGNVDAARYAETIQDVVDRWPASGVGGDDPDGLDNRSGRPRPFTEVFDDGGVELLVAWAGRLGQHRVDHPERDGASHRRGLIGAKTPVHQ